MVVYAGVLNYKRLQSAVVIAKAKLCVSKLFIPRRSKAIVATQQRLLWGFLFMVGFQQKVHKLEQYCDSKQQTKKVTKLIPGHVL